MILLLGIAWAGPTLQTLDVPFPTTRVFTDKPDKVCLKLKVAANKTKSSSQMTDFDVECTVANGWMNVCLTLTSPRWPKRPPPIECGPEGTVVRMFPKRAYHPTEDVWDGVSLLASVDILEAEYRIDHPDAAGIMDRGECGIRDGLFWFETEEDVRRQSCILVLDDGSERVVPIELVNRLRPLGE